MPLLLFLILLFLVPWLGLALFVFVGLLFLVLIPLGIAGGALFSVLARPSLLVSIFLDPKVKKIHGLEHATCHVLAQRGYGCSPGTVDRGGFSIRGSADPSLIFDAAKEALELLKSGRRDLAVHPRCGATLVAVNLLFSLLFLVAIAFWGGFGFLSVIGALALAQLLGPVVAPFAQKWLTTDWKVGSLVISGVESRPTMRQVGGFSVMMSDAIYVSVHEDGGVIEAEVVL